MKYLSEDKYYKVNGKLFCLLFKIKSYYELPVYGLDEKSNKPTILPSQEYKIHEVLGEVIAMLKNMEFEEL